MCMSAAGSTVKFADGDDITMLTPLPRSQKISFSLQLYTRYNHTFGFVVSQKHCCPGQLFSNLGLRHVLGKRALCFIDHNVVIGDYHETLFTASRTLIPYEECSTRPPYQKTSGIVSITIDAPASTVVFASCTGRQEINFCVSDGDYFMYFGHCDDAECDIQRVELTPGMLQVFRKRCILLKDTDRYLNC